MGIRIAMVDRIVQIRKETTGQRVEGTTRYTEVESPLIKCRFDIVAAGETLEDGRVVTEPTPTAMVYKKDLEGNAVLWKSSDRCRIISKQLGTFNMEVNGAPSAIRKKKTLLGWQLVLHRTDEAEA